MFTMKDEAIRGLKYELANVIRGLKYELANVISGQY
jgi:hypothetical protein